MNEPPAEAWAPVQPTNAAVPSRPPGTCAVQVPRSRRPSERFALLAGWLMAGLLGTASVALLPVGLVLLPIAGAFLLFLITRTHRWPEVLGLGPGVSTFCAYVAYRNRNHVSCADLGSVVASTPGQEFHCGGTAPGPWLILALALLSIAAATYAFALLTEIDKGRRQGSATRR